MPTPGPTNEHPFPKTDTSYDKAIRAPVDLWRGYDVTEFQGRHLLAAVHLMALVNASDGSVSDSEALALDGGVVRAVVGRCFPHCN